METNLRLNSGLSGEKPEDKRLRRAMAFLLQLVVIRTKKYTTGAKTCCEPWPTCGGIAPVYPNLRYQKDVSG
jgi:hypothetical protein